MNKIFDDAKHKNVAAFVVYAKAADSKIYVDDEFEEQAKQADIEDAFNHGRLIVMNEDVALIPVALDANKVATIDVAGTTVSGAEWEALATPAG